MLIVPCCLKLPIKKKKLPQALKWGLFAAWVGGWEEGEEGEALL